MTPLSGFGRFTETFRKKKEKLENKKNKFKIYISAKQL